MSSTIAHRPRPSAQGPAARLAGPGTGVSARSAAGGAPARAQGHAGPVPHRGVPLAALHGATLLAVWAAALLSLGGVTTPSAAAAAITVAVVLTLGDQVLSAGRLTVADPLVRAGLAVGTGVTAVLLTGLLLNTVGPPLGVAAPLRALPVAAAITLVSVALHLLAPRDAALRPAPALPAPAALLGLGALALLPLAAASGAIALGNGRSSVVATTTLVAIIVVLGGLGLRRRPPSRAAAAATIYAVALALLLMTSLRGPTVTGHDILSENFVASTTAAAGLWAPTDGKFGDYSACLSITVLPAMLSALFHTTTDAVLEVVGPVLFAACPVIVLLVAERLAGLRLAIPAAVLFVSFPTFFTDMSMMVRQEMAFLVVAALVLVIATRSDDLAATPGTRLDALTRRRALVVLLGVGAVLSHYSTTYLLVAQLAMALAAAVALALLGRLRARRRARAVARTGATPAGAPLADRAPADVPATPRRLLSVGVVAALAASAYLWAGPVTGTGSSFVGVARSSIDIITGVASSTGGSADLSVSLFGGGDLPTPQDRLDAYAVSLVENADPAERPAVVELLTEYPAVVAPLETTAPTALGEALESLDVSPFDVTAVVRAGSAAALQLVVGVGVLLVLWRGLRGRYDLELALMAGGALALLAAFLALPMLSDAYGLLRVFQQGLVVLAVPAVLVLDAAAGGFTRLLSRARRRARPASRRPTLAPGSRAGGALAPGAPRLVLVAVLAFTASSTGLSAAAIGGYYPPLHLANAGRYYDDYHQPDTDEAMMLWTADQPRVAREGRRAVQGDQWTSARFASATGVVPSRGILPPQLREDSFVVMGRANVVEGRASDGLVNQPIPYTYPWRYLEMTKDRVYDDGAAQVWR